MCHPTNQSCGFCHDRVVVQVLLDAIEDLNLLAELVQKHAGHFKFELDLEVIAYGRNYNGKKVGPYLRLLEYNAGEDIIRQGFFFFNNSYTAEICTLPLHDAVQV